MPKKVTLEMVWDVVSFMKNHMVTKKEFNDRLDPIEDRLSSVEKKVDGIYKVLDVEVQKHADTRKRVVRLEEKVLG